MADTTAVDAGESANIYPMPIGQIGPHVAGRFEGRQRIHNLWKDGERDSTRLEVSPPEHAEHY